MKNRPKKGAETEAGQSRRDFLSNLSMGAGLVTSHLFAAGLAVRYLYPEKRDQKQRIFVGLSSEMPPGSAVTYKAPDGKTINVVRGPAGFVALSDVCPHLGCSVHFESTTAEFICPCHDGHFDAEGAPISGPPAEMGAGLPQYDVMVENDIVFLELAIEKS